jgi:hypothetical protein
MKDTELDELLNTWKTPLVRGSWREGVQNRIAGKTRKPLRRLLPRWRLLAAGTLMAGVLLLLANTSAFSRRLSPPPYTVDSEIRQYLAANMEAENLEDVVKGSAVWRTGVSPALTLMVTSYSQAGSEVILSASFPNQTLKSLVGQIFLAFWGMGDRLKRRFMPASEEETEAFAVVYPSSPRSDMVLVLGRRDALMNSGCQTGYEGAKVVGNGVILNYSVTAVQRTESSGRQMVTLWMAPELSCFALRATVHARQQDGTWKLISDKQALKVTVNR